MDDEWASDGLDEALASAAALVEGTQTPANSPKLVIEISEDEYGYYDWQRAWEMQNLHNGLNNEESRLPSDVVDIGQPWQSLDSLKLSSESDTSTGDQCAGLQVMEPDIVSFWNFLNIFEDPELQKHRVPTHGLVLTKLRHQKSDEYWEYLIWKTSQFIRRINKRK